MVPGGRGAHHLGKQDGELQLELQQRTDGEAERGPPQDGPEDQDDAAHENQ